MKVNRLLVNDCLTCIPGTRTFWHDLKDWFHMDFIGAPYDKLATIAAIPARNATLIIRNASWFPPIDTKCPQISLLQDVMEHGPMREMQEAVISTLTYGVSTRHGAVVFNSNFTRNAYKSFLDSHDKGDVYDSICERVIPLPVDFNLFKPGNSQGLQQEMNIPAGAICWVGACYGTAGEIKGWDVLVKIARMNPDLKFIAVMKDGFPESFPPNMRVYCKLKQEELAKVMGACSVGLCTSRMESQHLAGIEMGACGLPMVVPPIGTYFGRKDIPGVIVNDPKDYTSAIRATLKKSGDSNYWRKEFDREVIKAQWDKLIEEVECSGQS